MGISFFAGKAPSAVNAIYFCQCIPVSEGAVPDPECLECKGTGVAHTAECSPFEMSLSGASASFLLDFLGKEGEFCGSIPASETLSLAINIHRIALEEYHWGRKDHDSREVQLLDNLASLLLYCSKNRYELCWG